ncbi:MAG: DUF4465 domain-containing protein [Paludibacteraceae bacterium]|nr:DUF4465 domain-containing protein [Paludibacteraceae bacterium]
MKKNFLLCMAFLVSLGVPHVAGQELDIFRLKLWDLATKEARDESGFNIVLDTEDDESETEDGKWNKTYSPDGDMLSFYYEDENHEKSFTFSFSHSAPGMSSSDEMAYWDGFTFCTNGDNTDWGHAGSSTDWPLHQWGCMAGGGIDEEGNVVKGNPYLVGYWGYGQETPDDVTTYTLTIGFNATAFESSDLYQPLRICVCNHPWAYYGIQHDDGFAHSAADNGAKFELIIHGIDADGSEAGEPVRVTMAEFYDNYLHISPDWKWVDISSLGPVAGLFFTMDSYDMTNETLGMNTAAYFCLGGLEVQEIDYDAIVPRPANVVATAISETEIELTWDAQSTDDIFSYNIYMDNDKIVTIDNEGEDNTYTISDLAAYTEYEFYVEGVSAKDNETLSPKGYAKTRTLDTHAPSKPQNVTATCTTTSIRLQWDAATDNIGIKGYNIKINDHNVFNSQNSDLLTYSSSFLSKTITQETSNTSLAPGKTYTIKIRAVDLSDNSSEWLEMEVTTLGEYKRTGLIAGRMGTICLPWASDSYKGATFYRILYKQLYEGEPYNITLEEVTQLEPGVPYIFVPEAEEIKVFYQKSSEESTPKNMNGLYGTFEQIQDHDAGSLGNQLEGNYIVYENKFHRCADNCSLAANRAYIKMDEVPEEGTAGAPAPVPGRRHIVLGGEMPDKTPTALQSADGEDAGNGGGVYDVLGRRLNGNAVNHQGVYIINGKKVIK